MDAMRLSASIRERHLAASQRDNLESALGVCGEGQTGTDASLGEDGKVGQNCLLAHAPGQIIQHIVDGDAQAANAGLVFSTASQSNTIRLSIWFSLVITEGNQLSQKMQTG
jgi:uncharacterized low-complexity protein